MESQPVPPPGSINPSTKALDVAKDTLYWYFNASATLQAHHSKTHSASKCSSHNAIQFADKLVDLDIDVSAVELDTTDIPALKDFQGSLDKMVKGSAPMPAYEQLRAMWGHNETLKAIIARSRGRANTKAKDRTNDTRPVVERGIFNLLTQESDYCVIVLRGLHLAVDPTFDHYSIVWGPPSGYNGDMVYVDYKGDDVTVGNKNWGTETILSTFRRARDHPDFSFWSQHLEQTTAHYLRNKHALPESLNRVADNKTYSSLAANSYEILCNMMYHALENDQTKVCYLTDGVHNWMKLSAYDETPTSVKFKLEFVDLTSDPTRSPAELLASLWLLFVDEYASESSLFGDLWSRRVLAASEGEDESDTGMSQGTSLSDTVFRLPGYRWILEFIRRVAVTVLVYLFWFFEPDMYDPGSKTTLHVLQTRSTPTLPFFRLGIFKNVLTRQGVVMFSRYDAIIVKVFIHKEHFENEVEVYTKLAGNDGVLPLLATGVTSHEQRFIVLPCVGEPIVWITDTDARCLYKAVLEPMHKLGYHHHDLHRRNVLRDRHGRLFLIDFSDVSRSCPYGREGCPDYAWLREHSITPSV